MTPHSTYINHDIINLLPATDDIQQFISEADFGYGYISSYLNTLSEGARVLEVGSGPCILLSQLTRDFPHLHIHGIEPIGSGFNFIASSAEALQKTKAFTLHKGGYEDFEGEHMFDLIFLINVMEHLPDWRHFLRFVQSRLTPKGKCIILCPNYAFPYESHFRLTIIGGKALTYRLLKRRIEWNENTFDAKGLWQSLNFITWKQLKEACRDMQLSFVSHTTIQRDMVARIETDPEFAKRQKYLVAIAKTLARLKVLDFLCHARFQRVHPYMFVEISHG